MVVEKLDRLTLDEARTIAARILEVIYGLAQNMNVIMKGEQTDSVCRSLIIELPSRRQSINRPCPHARCPEYVVSDDE